MTIFDSVVWSKIIGKEKLTKKKVWENKRKKETKESFFPRKVFKQQGLPLYSSKLFFSKCN